MDIIFHTANGHYGFLHAIEQDYLYKEMQEWVITDFQVVSEQSSISHDSTEKIELVFPDEISMELLNFLFTFGPDDLDEFPPWSMKRILISFIHDSKSLQLEFISESSNQRAVAMITNAKIYEKLWTIITELDETKLRKYLVINENTSPV